MLPGLVLQCNPESIEGYSQLPESILYLYGGRSEELCVINVYLGLDPVT